MHINAILVYKYNRKHARYLCHKSRSIRSSGSLWYVLPHDTWDVFDWWRVYRSHCVYTLAVALDCASSCGSADFCVRRSASHIGCTRSPFPSDISPHGVVGYADPHTSCRTPRRWNAWLRESSSCAQFGMRHPESALGTRGSCMVGPGRVYYWCAPTANFAVQNTLRFCSNIYTNN